VGVCAVDRENHASRGKVIAITGARRRNWGKELVALPALTGGPRSQ